MKTDAESMKLARLQPWEYGGFLLRMCDEKNERIAALERVRTAAAVYFMNHLVDEAEDILCCYSGEQHKHARELREALKSVL